MIEQSLQKLGELLSLVEAGDGYVLFGSAVLYLHGLDTGRPVGDVDLFAARNVWARVFTLRQLPANDPVAEVRTPRVGDPPYLHVPADPPLSVFYDWPARDPWIDIERCLASAELVRGFRCVPLATLVEHKRQAVENEDEMAKHLADLALLRVTLAEPRPPRRVESA